ncbi:MAG: nucleotide sugar dehydrogenase [Clostridium sp.]|nr:nucleotide sugar dehydrogenase [Clostridium sp.]
MTLYDSLKLKKEKLSVIGLGYVGIGLAIAFSKKLDVIGFDINKNKINNYLNGIDPTNEVGNDELQKATLKFSSDPNYLKEAKFHIVAVPTPINDDCTPNLTPIIKASETVAKSLVTGAIVVYESTVYPGVTEEVCIPILEKFSGLICGKDFKVGYSPERINPGDKNHTLQNTIKIVSGMDEESLDTISKVYELIIDAGVYKAESIKIAEAAKVIENSQRDINIAFINELSLIFDKMNLDTASVLKAASTKWNFLSLNPGLVGGHCIGVDPYYLTYKAQLLGYNSQVILAGRTVNDKMGKYIAEKTIKLLIKSGCKIKDSNVVILGITFKENCPDIRNSKVIDIVNELKEYGINVYVSDPLADREEVLNEYNINLIDINSNINKADAVIISVAHNEYTAMSFDFLNSLFKDNIIPVLIDVKGILNKNTAEDSNFLYWRL